MANNPNAADNLKPFTKKDPRINRNGRPKSFDQLRKLAQSVAHEVARDKAGEPVVTKDGRNLTVAEAILKTMASDKKLMVHFLEVAYGKVPQPVELSIDEATKQHLSAALRDGRLSPQDILLAAPDLAKELFAQAGVVIEETNEP